MGATDSNGIAHYRLQLGREVKRLSGTLGTAPQPLLRPQHPSRIFEISNQDSILIVEQSFSLVRKPPTKKGHSPSAKKNDRAVPYRIGTQHPMLGGSVDQPRISMSKCPNRMR